MRNRTGRPSDLLKVHLPLPGRAVFVAIDGEARHEHFELRAIEHKRAFGARASRHDGARWRSPRRVTELSDASDRDHMPRPDAIDRGWVLVLARDRRLVFAELRER